MAMSLVRNTGLVSVLMKLVDKLRSISLRGWQGGEDKLLLIGSGDLLVEAAQLGVFLGIENREIMSEGAFDLDRTVLCGGDNP
jgi:hypothetical protein